MDIILEVIQTTIPALIVFATVYFLIKRFTDSQLSLQHLKNQAEVSGEAIKIKLHAYERLALFCERISLPNLLMRLRMSQMTNEDLKNALYIAIQKEHEHNMVQQIYVSDKLWQIINIAKENVLQMVDIEFNKLKPSDNGQELAEALYRKHNSGQQNPTGQALSAIKKETKLLL